jgi:hypothetical protein
MRVALALDQALPPVVSQFEFLVPLPQGARGQTETLPNWCTRCYVGKSYSGILTGMMSLSSSFVTI